MCCGLRCINHGLNLPDQKALDPDVSVFKGVTISSPDVEVASASLILSFPVAGHNANGPLSGQVHNCYVR